MADIQSQMMVAVGSLIGLALGTVVLLVIAGLGIVSAQVSANLTSAAVTLGSFAVLVAIFSAIKLFK